MKYANMAYVFAIKCMYIGKGVCMEYTKPVVLAQNNKQQSFAAGCPANNYGPSQCKSCERTA